MQFIEVERRGKEKRGEKKESCEIYWRNRYFKTFSRHFERFSSFSYNHHNTI